MGGFREREREEGFKKEGEEVTVGAMGEMEEKL